MVVSGRYRSLRAERGSGSWSSARTAIISSWSICIFVSATRVKASGRPFEVEFLLTPTASQWTFGWGP